MLVVDLLMVFGPVVGYISQYKLIKQSGTLGNFSIDVCAILLTSNILRLFFWYAERFGKALLFQALFMIVAQIILLHTCIKVRNAQGYKRCYKSTLQGVTSFWRWNRFQSYILFLSGYAFSLGMLTLIFVDGLGYKSFGQTIGFLSLSIEATLGFPQMIKNFTSKNVQGISLVLILTWFIGDFMKTVYFVVFKQPAQFILCGSIQLTVDLIILIQLMIYRKKGDSEQIGSIQVVDSPPRQFQTFHGV